MFESVCIRNQTHSDTTNPIDLGLLAESMLFYPNVLVIAKQHMLKQLVKAFTPDVLLEYLRAGYLQLRYEYEQTGISTSNSGSQHERHSAIIYHSPDHALQHVAPKMFAEITGKFGKGRRLANRFTDFVPIIEHGPSLLADVKTDFLDKVFVQSAAEAFFNSLAPEYSLPKPLIFEITQDGAEFVVTTNIDFVEINKIYHRRIPATHSSLTPAYFLSHILTVRENLYFTSTHAADIALDPVNSLLLAKKVNGILDRYKNNANQISAFQDFAFDDGKAVRDAINNGSRSFKELLDVLEHANKFRTWLQSKPMDTNLVKEYFREVTQSSWIDNLPTKSFRWAFFTGAGLVIDSLGGGGLGTALGVGISAADSLVIDRLIGGWKPSHFVEGSLQRFIRD